MIQPTLIIDADDTLWEAEVFYEQCISDSAALMASYGFDREEAERTIEAVEVERVPQVGYAPQEFARSLVVAYERLCERRGQPLLQEVADAVLEIGQLVVEPPMVLLEGVAETLPRLAGRFRLILLTKGDPPVQKGKLARSGLEPYFDGVHVVAEKDAGVIRDLVTRYRLVVERTWMVGNSPRSDINPALEAGIGAVYIPHTVAWSFEQEAIADPKRVMVLDSFRDLAVALPGADAELGA